jgi:hypothetical protein
VGGFCLSSPASSGKFGSTARVRDCKLKGEIFMTDAPANTETTRVAEKAAGLGLSLDVWAVALALGLVLLVWLGWIKQVPW